MESVWSWPSAARVSSRLRGGELTVEYPRSQWTEDSQVRRLDENNIGPKKDFRLPSPRWFVVATAAGLVAVTVTLIATSGGGRHVPRPRGPSTDAAAPAPSPAAAPGTVLLTCDSANSGQLERLGQDGELGRPEQAGDALARASGPGPGGMIRAVAWGVAPLAVGWPGGALSRSCRPTRRSGISAPAATSPGLLLAAIQGVRRSLARWLPRIR